MNNRDIMKIKGYKLIEPTDNIYIIYKRLLLSRKRKAIKDEKRRLFKMLSKVYNKHIAQKAVITNQIEIYW